MKIALVVLDTLRTDAFQRHFEWLPGRQYENAWAPSNWTAPVHSALFTGKYPSEVGVHSIATNLDCQETVLAEHLSTAGYTTRAFSANPNVSIRTEFDRGFEEFESSLNTLHLNNPDIFNWDEFIRETIGDGPERYVNALWRCITEDVKTIASLRQGIFLKTRKWLSTEAADDGAQTVLQKIKESSYSDDTFLFLNLMEAHGPYDPPEEYKTIDSHNKPTTVDALSGNVASVDADAVRRAYDDAVRYLSDIYAEIFDELSSDFDYIFTISDHGEMLGEHGLWDHLYGLHPELTHVPLVISGNNLSGTNDSPVSLLDVHQTILDLAGIDAPSRGKNLLEDTTRRKYLTEYHGMSQWLVEELEKKIDLSKVEQYNSPLRGVVLPPRYYGYETLDGWAEQGDTELDPEVSLTHLQQELQSRDVTPDDQNLSKEAMERLEDLGYA